jgi:hypothetical protein
MVVVPVERPVTIPLVASTVAIDILLLLQVPVEVASLSVIVDPGHTDEAPVIAAGRGFTVAMAVATQPVGKVYDMVAVPSVRPVTTPLPEPMAATEPLSLDHVPPPVFDNVVLSPWHTA